MIWNMRYTFVGPSKLELPTVKKVRSTLSPRYVNRLDYRNECHVDSRGAGHLRAIHNYIAADSPRHALRVVDRITRRTEALKSMPRLRAQVPEYGDDSIRELLYRSYRIIY